MPSLAFPQLSSGAMAQYPIRKVNTIRTIKNILADGSVLVAADPGAGQLMWTLSYAGLPPVDMNALQAHFEACGGPLRAFTFLDPTENLLPYSADLTGSSWIAPVGMAIAPGLADPLGGTAAFSVTNGGSAPQQITQTLAAPANFQYCFSVYAAATSAGSCSLALSSANAQLTKSCPLGPSWSRISCSGALNDVGSGLSVAITLAAGQTVSLFGPQLEPQLLPSRYRPTYSSAGLHLNAHWAMSQLVFTADEPGLFSTTLSISASVSS